MGNDSDDVVDVLFIVIYGGEKMNDNTIISYFQNDKEMAWFFLCVCFCVGGIVLKGVILSILLV